jgi:hypothetical protein
VQVGLADDDRAGPAQPAHDRRVPLRHQPGAEDPGSCRGRRLGGEHEVLHRHRHAEEGRQRAAPHNELLGVAGGPARLIAEDRDEGVELRVQALDPGERLSTTSTGEIRATDMVGDFEGVQMWM